MGIVPDLLLPPSGNFCEVMQTHLAFVPVLFFSEGMQYHLPLPGENGLLVVHRLLSAAFGSVSPFYRLDPVGQMILTILSGRTRDEIAMEKYTLLKTSLASWDELARMEPFRLRKLIEGVTFADRKAVHLPAALQAIIARRGRIELDFLAAWPIVKATSWLEGLTGVGPKTSAAILNSSTLRRRILMVDTAHNRAAQRLGLVPEKSDIARTTRLLNRQLPDAWTAHDTETHHALMQKLGQDFCVHGQPFCANCPLCRICPSASGVCEGS